MAEFLTTNAIIYHTENIIKEAREELYFLFPYLQLSREFYEALKGASERDVPIIIVYSSEDLLTEEKLKFSEIENLEIYQYENLNAKCCCSESALLIGSMDPHRMTFYDGFEMGILADRFKDEELYKKVYNEIKSVAGSSKNMNLHRRAVEELVQASVPVKKIYHGFCIKCAIPVSYNPDKPYCRSCNPKVEGDKSADISGKYCHLCGILQGNIMDSPLCGTCRDMI